MPNCPLTPNDVATAAGLPDLGKWMLDPTLTPAHWIGEVYRGKTLQEPINVILLDPHAGSPAEARARVVESCSKAGYPSRRGHSSGYLGCIGAELYPQLPDGTDHAFSDEPYVVDNDHGRLFGPHDHGGQLCFTGALSREKVVPWAAVRHQYVSFNRARDAFAQGMSERAGYEVRGYVDLENVIIDDAVTTGDHDGMAVLLVATT